MSTHLSNYVHNTHKGSPFIWDLDEQILDLFHEVHNILYDSGVGSLGSWGKTEKEMTNNLILILFVRSHEWDLSKRRHTNRTDLLVPTPSSESADTSGIWILK